MPGPIPAFNPKPAPVRPPDTVAFDMDEDEEESDVVAWEKNYTKPSQEHWA
jgi:hypothetical protein